MLLLLKSYPGWFGIGLIIAVNAMTLSGVAYNRSAEQEMVVTLTERELSLPYYWRYEKENNGIGLRVNYRSPGRGYGYAYSYENDDLTDAVGKHWLNREKLTELGFDTAVATDSEAGQRHYHKMLPKEVFIILEYDGARYQHALAQARQQLEEERKKLKLLPADKRQQERVKHVEEQLQQELQGRSRLFIIDAGIDATALRQLYTDKKQYLLVRGLVRVDAYKKEKDFIVTGHISGISVDNVNVPLSFRATLEPFLDCGRDCPRRTAEPPRYTVTIAYGKRHGTMDTGHQAVY